jgi:hypothetical protein
MSEPDSTQRRRPPTIDLTAKEVETEGASPAKDSATGGPAPGRADAGTAPANRVRHYAVGILFGAIAVAIIIAGLWVAGYVPARDAANAPAVPVVAKPAATDDIAARLDKLQQTIQAPKPDDRAAARLTADEAQQKALGEQLAALTRRVDEIAAVAQGAATQAKAAAAAADDAKSAAQAGVQRGDIEALANRIAALENAVKSLTAETAQRTSSADDNAARATVAAEALRAAAEGGAPYQAELTAVKSFGADQNAIAALTPFAADGIPSAAALGRELAALVSALQRAADSGAADGSLLGRLEARAQRLVRITPIDTASALAGNDAASLIARIDGDAARGDIAAALADVARLPDAARAPAEPWIKKAQARETAIAASRQIAANALASLGKPVSQ